LFVLLSGLTGCGPLVLSVDDAVMADGGHAQLVAYVGREHFLGMRSDIERVPVAFFIQDRKVGENKAGEDGRAAVNIDGIKDETTVFTARARAYGRTLQTTGRIFHWDKGRVILVVDIDHTISQTDFGNLLKDQVQVSRPVPGARETLAELAKEYHILYLTARPRFLIEKTREWLTRYDFPPGPVAAAPRVWDAMRQLKYKQKALHRWREQWPNLLIGIGNRTSDIEAYASSRMLPVIVFQNGEEKHYSDAVVLQDWQFLRRFFSANHDVLTSPAELVQVIDGQTMILQPLIPFEAARSHYRPMPFEPSQ
jgi:hypothetical protein